MESPNGYCQRVIVLKTDESVGKDGSAATGGRIWGKSTKKTIWGPSAKERNKKKGRWNQRGPKSTTDVGGGMTHDDKGGGHKRMYPCGTKLPKDDRNRSISNAPGNVTGRPLCWDFNAHGWCRTGDECFDMRDCMSNPNTHWRTGADMIRRGCFRQERRVPTDEVDGAIR